MKKGFTLVELLAVIVIIITITLIMFPAVTNTIKSSKESLYKVQIEDIELASKKWGTEYYTELDSNHLNNIYMPISYLQYLNYLEKDEIINPIDKSIMNGCIEISYNNDNSQYNYKYNDETCEIFLNNSNTFGYVYTKSGDNWIKEETKSGSLDPAFKTILNSNELLVYGNTSNGLYEFDNEYIFRGLSVNNYIKLNSGSDLWRIISIDKSNKVMKIMKNDSIAYNVWNNPNSIIFEESSLYSEILTNYLNNKSNSINSLINKIDQNFTWNVGSIENSTFSYTVLKSKQTAKKIYANIGLISLGDYIGASLDESCQTDYLSTSCINSNYLGSLFSGKTVWTINNSDSQVWIVNNSGAANLANSTGLYYIYPVVNLISSVYISSGSGTNIDPYILKG